MKTGTVQSARMKIPLSRMGRRLKRARRRPSCLLQQGKARGTGDREWRLLEELNLAPKLTKITWGPFLELRWECPGSSECSVQKKESIDLQWLGLQELKLQDVQVLCWVEATRMMWMMVTYSLTLVPEEGTYRGTKEQRNSLSTKLLIKPMLLSLSIATVRLMMSRVEKPKTGGRANQFGCVEAGKEPSTPSMLQKKEFVMTESIRLSSTGHRKESLDSVFGDMRLGEMILLQPPGLKRG